MALKMSELREKDTGSLQNLEKELTESLFAARLQNKSGQLENHAKLTLTRRDLARVKTVLRARELGLEVIETPSGDAKPESKKAKPAAAPAKAKAAKAKAPAKKGKAPAKAKAAPKAKSKSKSAAKPAKAAKKSAGKKK